jgi:hypothetical protein
LPHEFEQVPIFKTTSGVKEQEYLNARLNLGQSYPNPASTTVTIPLAGVPNGGSTRLAIYDATGREVYSAPVRTGMTSVQVDVNALPPGSYTYALTSGGVRRTEQMVIAR